jgi:hypothetical protein
MPNRLAAETSPYLLQHAGNPVDWYPWGPEAFEKARADDKPVFLSVGYSACHWCHVMAHESFEDPETAALMNRLFVSVKVDREERPDVDAIYMDAVQALTGQGGWPMSVFLTPDGAPFFGGTYFPVMPRHGMPSFFQVLTRVAELWEARRDEIVRAGSDLTMTLRRDVTSGAGGEGEPLERETLQTAIQGLSRSFDEDNGGFGGAPKFPQPAVVEFLLRRHLATGDEHILSMATKTLDSMAHGGIYDQLGGGFHRYATDAVWLVPHFEKMLYDNAQLARLYLHAWQVTGVELYRRVTTQTLDYLAREMLDPAGGFYSAQDADTEGEEGRFYVWALYEIADALKDASDDPAGDAELFMAAYGVSAGPNFEGRSILFVAETPSELASRLGLDVAEVETRIERSRRALLAARDARTGPGLDDKALAGWNGLALAAFAEAARVLGRDDYRAIAEKNADFLLTDMRDARGRMQRSWKGGHAKLGGYLEDHANVADGLLELYQTTFEPRWFAAARELADAILEHFADTSGGFFDTSDDHETLLLRPKGIQDGAVPSGGAMASAVLLRLAEYTGDGRYADAAEAALAQVQQVMAQFPLGAAQWLAALDFALAPPREVAIVGEELEAMLEVVRAKYRPNLVVAAGRSGEDEGIALLEGREAVEGRAAAHVCHGSACERPVTGAKELEGLLA